MNPQPTFLFLVSDKNTIQLTTYDTIDVNGAR